MTVPRHLEDSAGRLKDAERRIKAARAKPASLDSQREWLAALTDYSVALCDIQEYGNESIHEKLHELAARTGVRKAPWPGPRK